MLSNLPFKCLERPETLQIRCSIVAFFHRQTRFHCFDVVFKSSRLVESLNIVPIERSLSCVCFYKRRPALITLFLPYFGRQPADFDLFCCNISVVFMLSFVQRPVLWGGHSPLYTCCSACMFLLQVPIGTYANAAATAAHVCSRVLHVLTTSSGN